MTDSSSWVSGTVKQDGELAQVFGLVLAAGQSTRMGQQKLLLPVDGVTTLIRHVLMQAAKADLDGLLVVESGDEPLIRETADGPWQRITNPHANEGMSTSIRLGVSMIERSLADGVLVLLGDTPDVTVSTINRVAERFRMEYGVSRQARDAVNDDGARRGAADADCSEAVADDMNTLVRSRPLIVQASYRGVPSHPVVFSRSLFGELLQVEGDEGAKAVIQKHRAHRVLVDVNEDVPVDLDTPDAYDKWRKRNHRIERP